MAPTYKDRKQPLNLIDLTDGSGRVESEAGEEPVCTKILLSSNKVENLDSSTLIAFLTHL